MELIKDNYTDIREYELTCPHCKSTYKATYAEALIEQQCNLCYWKGVMPKIEIVEPDID